jgi:hypothetical protein
MVSPETATDEPKASHRLPSSARTFETPAGILAVDFGAVFVGVSSSVSVVLTGEDVSVGVFGRSVRVGDAGASVVVGSIVGVSADAVVPFDGFEPPHPARPTVPATPIEARTLRRVILSIHTT